MNDKPPENKSKAPSTSRAVQKQKSAQGKDSRLKDALRKNLRRRKQKQTSSDQNKV